MDKGKLEIVIGKYNYHKLCRVGDSEHKDVLEDIPTEQAMAYLKEIVRRWNAPEQVSAGEFTEKLRNFVKMYKNEVPRRAEITFLIEACDRLDRAGASKAELLFALQTIAKTEGATIENLRAVAEAAIEKGK